ncbi:MAG TPA: ABC transporter permease [Terriglobales bacterium]|nr:ABC transporter permease [Terriglobales bacterium]
MQVLRHALRRLVHDPGFALVAVLTLALGIGATTAMFSLVDGVLLRPLNFPHPEQLVSLDQSIPQFTGKYPFFPVNAASFAAWRRDSKLLANIGLVEPNDWVLTQPGARPREVYGALVSASLFPTLGVAPLLGRTPTASEDQPNQNHVVLLSYPFWKSEFHADPSVLGRVISLNGTPHQIIGVLPASLHFPHGSELGTFYGGTGGDHPAQIFKPLGLDLANANAIGQFNYFAVARIRPGVQPQQLRAELDGIESVLLAAKHAPAGIQVHTVITSLQDQFVGNHALGLWMLLGAVAIILLIVCLNLANLLLVRMQGRAHEIAIRVALGAGRKRLVRETMVEALCLALAGGALGVLAAEAALRWLVAGAPSGLPRLDEVGINLSVLGFSFVLALLCAAAFSLWPALRASKADPQLALRAGARGSGGAAGKLRARAWLVGAQAALAALLLIVTGLLSVSYLRLLQVSPGYHAESVVEAQVDVPTKRFQRAQFLQAALDRLATLPGVHAAALIDTAPTDGVGDTDLLSYVHDTRPLVDRPLAIFSAVSSDYFNAMGIPLQRGRTFTQAEVAVPLALADPKVKASSLPPLAAVVSAYTASHIWPGKDAIGQQFTQSDPDSPTMVVVGIAGDVRGQLSQPPGLQVYLPYTFNIPSDPAIVLRASAPPAEMSNAIRQTIWSVEPDVAVPSIESFSAMVSNTVAPRRFQLTLVLLFALCAMLLAALGIYGVISYAVERRASEIGLRMTLGASGADLIAMIMRQGLTPVVLGLVAGIAAALASGRLLASLLFGVRASDPLVIAAISGLVVAIGAVACLLPALRATRIDPLLTMRP